MRIGLKCCYDGQIHNGWLNVFCSEENYDSVLDYLGSVGFCWFRAGSYNLKYKPLLQEDGFIMLGIKLSTLEVGQYRRLERPIHFITAEEFLINETTNLESSQSLNNFLSNMNIKG